MVQRVEHDLSWAVEPFVPSEIRALVEPVVCRGGATNDHEGSEAECVETGVGYVVYECPTCGHRVMYHHATGGAEPCCGPRS